MYSQHTVGVSECCLFLSFVPFFISNSKIYQLTEILIKNFLSKKIADCRWIYCWSSDQFLNANYLIFYPSFSFIALRFVYAYRFTYNIQNGVLFTIVLHILVFMTPLVIQRSSFDPITYFVNLGGEHSTIVIVPIPNANLIIVLNKCK